MMIKKEDLKPDVNIEGSYVIEVTLNNENLELRLDPDDVAIEETIALANKIISNFEEYQRQAKDRVVSDFLETYNESWADEEDGFPQLNEEQFRANLTLDGINFLSKDSIDVLYTENGMFGNHSLIAQSFDGESFDDSTMFG